ncbi:hypothetical protein [Salinibacter sp.]|uniref:hypothetical protein n=1 Tax=Salinibacter sp. TaxID=2065818 RepID=UPI0021E8A7B3|nr:hypothetical protein [Salinibacter sp.]
MERYDAYADDAVYDPEGSEYMEVFGGKDPGDWVYCAHCGKLYQMGWYREEGAKQMCPFPGCDGDAVTDPMDWRGDPPEEAGVSIY